MKTKELKKYMSNEIYKALTTQMDSEENVTIQDLTDSNWFMEDGDLFYTIDGLDVTLIPQIVIQKTLQLEEHSVVLCYREDKEYLLIFSNDNVEVLV